MYVYRWRKDLFHLVTVDAKNARIEDIIYNFAKSRKVVIS